MKDYDIIKTEINGEKGVEVYNLNGDLVQTFIGDWWDADNVSIVLRDLRKAYAQGYKDGRSATQAKIREAFGMSPYRERES